MYKVSDKEVIDQLAITVFLMIYETGRFLGGGMANLSGVDKKLWPLPKMCVKIGVNLPKIVKILIPKGSLFLHSRTQNKCPI